MRPQTGAQECAPISFALMYEQAKAGALQGHTYIPIRSDTPKVVIDTLEQVNESVENHSLVMQVRKAQQAMYSSKNDNRTKKYGAGSRVHGLTAEQIIDVISGLDNPSFAV